MAEITALRTEKTKTFDLGGNKRQTVCSLTTVHVPENMADYTEGREVVWRTPDATLVAKPGNTWEATRQWYGFTVTKGSVGFVYTSRKTGEVITIKLLELGGVPVKSAQVPDPRQDGVDIWFDDIVPGFSVFLQVTNKGVEIFKLISTASAPRSMLWSVERPVGSTIPIDGVTGGRDNYGRLDPARVGLGPGRCRSLLVMDPPVLSTPVVGRVFESFTILESWSGQVQSLDVNRVPSLSTDVSYPVIIDVLVTEVTPTDDDDGAQLGDNTWDEKYPYASGNNVIWGYNATYRPAWRFTTVAIPQGATIDDATLEWGVAAGGGTTGGFIYADDVDNASTAWASSLPATITKTTASTAWIHATTGTNSYDVATIIQEIVDRAGWVTGNNLRMACLGVTGGSGAYMYIGDSGSVGAAGVTPVPTLTINYTAAGGGGGRIMSSLAGPGGLAGFGGIAGYGGGLAG